MPGITEALVEYASEFSSIFEPALLAEMGTRSMLMNVNAGEKMIDIDILTARSLDIERRF